MIIGVPREIKNQEYRVAIVPRGVRELVKCGHRVIVERAAGEGSGISDKEYIHEGAEIAESPECVYREAEMVVKVKEPLPQEYHLFYEGQILFSYLHLAASLELTKAMLDQKVIAIAYETVQLEDGYAPLNAPMSEVAGRLSVQVGAHYLQKDNGGSGLLLGGVPGVSPANVTIIGAGTVGANAAKIALGMGANVTVLDIDVSKLRHLSEISSGALTTLAANDNSIENAVANADLVVGAVLIPGAAAPKLVTRNMISRMRQGSVVVDVAIDQGGCIETGHPTDFDHPVFTFDGVLHCCIANMPAAVAQTSTLALTNATFPYVRQLANLGFEEAVVSNRPLVKGVNLFKGNLTCKAVADSLSLQYVPFETLAIGQRNRRQK